MTEGTLIAEIVEWYEQQRMYRYITHCQWREVVNICDSHKCDYEDSLSIILRGLRDGMLMDQCRFLSDWQGKVNKGRQCVVNHAGRVERRTSTLMATLHHVIMRKPPMAYDCPYRVWMLHDCFGHLEALI